MNTASRMESTSHPGHIQVSEATWNLLKDTETFKPTGGIEIKGKGLMPTFIWDGQLPRIDNCRPKSDSIHLPKAQLTDASLRHFLPGTSGSPPMVPGFLIMEGLNEARRKARLPPLPLSTQATDQGPLSTDSMKRSRKWSHGGQMMSDRPSHSERGGPASSERGGPALLGLNSRRRGSLLLPVPADRGSWRPSDFMMTEAFAVGLAAGGEKLAVRSSGILKLFSHSTRGHSPPSTMARPIPCLAIWGSEGNVEGLAAADKSDANK